MSFETLGLAEPLLRNLAAEGYTAPTPIQTAAIPKILSGRDLVGIAQTGTGKTAAFALPILAMLAKSPMRPHAKSCRVLVLSPTRELSAQITESFKTYGRSLPVSVTLAIGGVPIGRQIRSLAKGVEVLVATPGRLLDLCRSGAARLDEVTILVLDEADRMLDLGFLPSIRQIAALLPRKRQTLLFSATMPDQIASLARDLLVDPETVRVSPPASTVERVTQRAIHVGRSDKPSLLASLLVGETIDRAIVFTRTKHGADKVARGLVKAGIDADAIHGNKSQGQRERTLAAFRSGKLRTLVATDIAARGIDVDGVSHVINYDLPEVAETYVHRIGRTARAGNSGIAISFCAADEVSSLRDIEKLIRFTIPAEGDVAPAQASAQPRDRDAPRGRGARRTGRTRQAATRPAAQAPSQAAGGDDLATVAFLKPSSGRRGNTQQFRTIGRPHGQGRTA